MGLVFTKWACAFVLCCCLITSGVYSVEGLHGGSKVRGVNLGGWLVIEGWIKPSLFDGIANADTLDGTEVQFKSVTLQKYASAENGGGMNVTVDRDAPSSWETFRAPIVKQDFKHDNGILRIRFAGVMCGTGSFIVSPYFCCSYGEYLNQNFNFVPPKANFLHVMVEAALSLQQENLLHHQRHGIERDGKNRIHLKIKGGTYLQATTNGQLMADYPGAPGWDDNAATFEMTIASNKLHGDYQLANGYGHGRAKDILRRHRNSFITIEDFKFLYKHGINTVRIPVGWWIAYDPDPPSPFIGGSLEALDNAFSWAQEYDIKCIIDLHAAPASQNGMEHSASRDGFTGWPTSPDYISDSLHVIDFLISRYARNPALLGIELLNEPSAATVSLDVLLSYYKQGYQIVRKYSSSAYVIICQRIGVADPMELYQANIGSHNLVLDLHFYNLFDTYFDNMSAMDNVQYIYKSREGQLQALNNSNGPLVLVGEWVNEWNVTNGSQKDYQDFAKAQLDVYNAASFGWCYWTLKNEEKHWDFEWSIRNNYLQLGNSPSKRRLNILGLLGLPCTWFYLLPFL